MKKIILLLTISLMSVLQSSAQYSNYYKVNVNQNINAKVDVNQKISGEITYKTIDYGALAKANALKEQNRLKSLVYKNAEEKQRALEIAQNPRKAYDYGKWIYQKVKKKENGYKKTFVWIKQLHNSLFRQSGFGFENLSEDFVNTRISLLFPQAFNKKQLKGENIIFKNLLELSSPVKFAKLPFITVGEMNDINGDGVDEYYHKKEFSRGRLFGKTAYIASVFAEDDFEIFIKDYYVAESDGIIYLASATFSGDKKLVNFEQLEGRRFYFKNTISEFFSTAYTSEKNPKTGAFWKAMLTQ
jgi:hypothetical protein